MDRPLDGYATTRDWQESPTRIAVLPVGSCEQHGGRLPLLADSILAEHFAGLLARSLGAAQLPLLPYATSHEHTGFRGSFSLRPETAMAVVRDLVDALERQGFTRVVVVNGHGGNFFLGPVVREINAADRPIKVLIVECGGPFDSSPEGARLGEGELHAGASEISRILHIRPDTVRPPSAALPAGPGRGEALRRSDLNTFGVGCRDCSGVWGDALGGDAEAGRTMAASIAANQLAFVRERLAWLAEQPAYAGAGGIAIRRLVADDLDAGMRLCALAGWNQLPDDWRLFLELRPEGCFAAVRNGQVIGTATTLASGTSCGWIGMVLVDPSLRRMGVGTLLMQAAMASLAAVGAVGLDATAAGRPVYQRLGFADGPELRRLIRRSPSPGPAPGPGIRAMRADDLPALAALDAAAFGADRLPLLRWLLTRHPGLAWVAAAGGMVSGGLLGRPGAVFTQFGPLLAPDLATAQALLATALAACRGAVGLDVPPHQGWPEWLAGLGFAEERRFVRMFRGPAPTGDASRLWAIAGPELG